MSEIKTFESGARRSTDADDTRYDLIDSKAMELLSRTLAIGEKRYGKNNWKSGMPTEDVINHALRHLYKWLDGDRSEPHLTHAFANLMFACHFDYDEELKLHQLPVEDLPVMDTLKITNK